MKESNKTEQDLLIEVQGDQLRFQKKKLDDQTKGLLQQQNEMEKQAELIAEQTRFSQILSKETI
jgi:hypothetical protein